ncbi:alpha-galactosidase [Niveispirillum lacus]|uniref:alpha-galactosidase n=1 Tax=Niveispirillum lacus TaxID=1981099 RepID=A0A255YZD8_9PROT|nr:alpha-galactosidase [Niveispirillum lacus]OYQ34541.1 alpha-galactosidase [Niveispirillum lacus]
MLPTGPSDFVRLDGGAVSLVLDVRGPSPVTLYWGTGLDAGADGSMLDLLAAREDAPCSPLVAAPLALTPLAGQAFPGRPGLLTHGEGRRWATYTRIVDVRRPDPGAVEIDSVDEANGVALTHHLRLDRHGMLVGWTQVRNDGPGLLDLEWLSAPVLALPPHLVEWVTFEGRWAGEYRMQTQPRVMGAVVKENRRGRTSHDAFPGILAQAAGAGDQAGEVYGLHLGWSGNHRLYADTLSDGRAYVQMGELFMPGEMRLAPGQIYRTPVLYAACSLMGRNGISACFHAHVRNRPDHARVRAKPRPVHYNTWEAVYFDHDPALLLKLVDAAADIGVERFVLDDGWFRGRRSDRAGLGDWFVDEGIYPDGLHPIVARVRERGMEFGLWVEPEMVNPDSDLYRAHPDWVLGTPPAPQLVFRNQLVLDASRVDVQDYLFARLDALLRDYPISYLKWDMNRDISHPGGVDGVAAAHAHVEGLYALLRRVRDAYPDVEIESCSAGGGRADLGILSLTDRVWASDSNDALDRLTIQRGLSTFLPPELIGSHVGPTDCHITGRRVAMATRVATAMFFHLGLEVNLLGLSDAERMELAAGISLHKHYRPLLHDGRLIRLDRPANEEAFGILAADGAQALYSFTLLSEPSGYFAGRLRLAGLDPAARYHVRLLWPDAAQKSPLFNSLRDGVLFTGSTLTEAGLQLPRLHPQSALILGVVRVPAG